MYVAIEFPKPNRKHHPHAEPGFILRACGHVDETFYTQLVNPNCLDCVLAPTMERKAREN